MCNDCYFDLNDPIFVQDTIQKSWQLVDWQQVMLGGVMEIMDLRVAGMPRL